MNKIVAFILSLFLYTSIYAENESRKTVSSTMEKTDIKHKNINDVIDNQGAIVRHNKDSKNIYLIFSADKSFEGASHILSVLDRNKAKASFFLTGNSLRNKEFESIIKAIIRKGHYVGGHSDNHLLYASWDDRQTLLVTPDSLKNDFRKNMDALAMYGINTDELKYYLSPFEWYNKESVRLIESLGQNVINMTPGIRTGADYTTPDMKNYASSDELINQLYTFEKENGLNGSIFLIHPGTQHERTDKLYLRLDEIIKTLMKKGYKFERF